MRFKFKYILPGAIILLISILIFFQYNSSGKNVPAIKSKIGSVKINSGIFKVELAATPAQQVLGLSYRQSMPQDQGMLFIFKTPSRHNFWMFGMKFPLDIIFISNDIVAAVYENLPPADPGDKNPPQYGQEVISDKVLEINAGMAKKYGIKKGDNIYYQIN